MISVRKISAKRVVNLSAAVLLMAVQLFGFWQFKTAAALPPTDNLVGHWAMNENSGTTTANTGATGLNGTFSSTPTWTSGVDGSALSFNGTDSVNIGNISAINGKQKVTLAAWMKRTGTSQKVVVGKQANNHDFTIELWDDGKVYFQVSNGSWAYGEVTLNDTEWHHYALVFDGSQTGNANRLKGYIDGVQQNLQISGTVPATTTTNTATFRIGRVWNDYSNGTIDDVWLYSKALTPAEITSLQTYMNVIDTEAPSIPTALAVSGVSHNQATINWSASSDNTAVTGYRVFRDGVQVADTPGLSFTHSNLAASTTYAYTVSAYDAAGNISAQSQPLSVTTLAPPPVPTLSITATPAEVALGATTQLDWSSQDATSCVASGNWSGAKELSGSSNSGAIQSASTFTLTCDGPGGQASASVAVTVMPQCRDGLDNDGDSLVDDVDPGCATPDDNDETNDDVTPPSVPQNAVATATSHTAVTVTWEASSDNVGVSSYRVFRDGLQVSDQQGLTFNDTGLSAETTYQYTVVAYDSAGNVSAASAAANVTTPAAPAPPTVTLTANPTSIEAGSTSFLTWSSTNADTCVASGGWTGSKATSGSQQTASLVASTSYTLTCTGLGGQAAASATVSVADTTAPSVPANLTATAQSATTVVLGWDASNDATGVTGYRIFRNGTLLTTVTTTAFQDTNLVANTEYSYAVSSVDAAGNESAQSMTQSVTTLSTPAAYSISGDQRKILDQNGNPLFINGEAAWSLFVELDQQEVIQYLNDRQAKGFNLLMVNVLEYAFSSNPPYNVFGQGPFTTPNDYATPNEAYFQHVDWVMQEATSRGFTMLLVPSYIGYGGAGTTQGWYDEMVQNGAQKMYNFGYYLGNRYKSYPNIIWANGGDWNPQNRSVVDEMAKGLKAAAPNQLHTAHTGPDQEASTYWGGYSWLDIDNVYNYNNVYSGSQYIYQNRNQPFFMLESNYENEHSVTQHQLRAQAYQSVLAGSIGHVFGNCPVWNYSTDDSWCDTDNINWQTALNFQGSQSMNHFGNLFRSRDWASLVPDFNHTVLTSGYATGGFNYDVAARTDNGNTVIAYYHNNRSMTFDMTKVSGSTAQAWWYNPSNGQTQNAGQWPTTGTRSFTTPSGNADWVLVLDNASLNLPAPGTLTPDITNPTVTINSPVTGSSVNGVVTVAVTANDDRAISTVNFSLDGQSLGSDTSAPYELAFQSAAYANGQHAITATAVDTTGNQAQDSVTVNFNNVIDTAPPTVSISSPTQDSSVSGTVTISADAADDVAVAGITFYANGQAIGTEDTSAPYSTSWNTGGLANGTYTLTAVARDTSNKTTTSTAVSVTVANTAPSSLLVALGFNNSNSPLIDSSSYGNNATCSTVCPSFAATGDRNGGGAYNFAGTGNWLALPNESQFDFTNNFTVSFWMKSNGFANAWEALVTKGDSAWGIARYDSTSNATFTTFAPGPHDLRGNININDGNWHHIAIVYNGSQKLLYTDGVLSASANYTNSISTNNLAVRLGFNQEYAPADYTGWLDDVRIYNTSRSLSEIQADMNTPVN